MFIHTIVYVVLSVLSITAVYAASMPISKEPREHKVPETEKETENTL